MLNVSKPLTRSNDEKEFNQCFCPIVGSSDPSKRERMLTYQIYLSLCLRATPELSACARFKGVWAVFSCLGALRGCSDGRPAAASSCHMWV